MVEFTGPNIHTSSSSHSKATTRKMEDEIFDSVCTHMILPKEYKQGFSRIYTSAVIM